MQKCDPSKDVRMPKMDYLCNLQMPESILLMGVLAIV